MLISVLGGEKTFDGRADVLRNALSNRWVEEIFFRRTFDGRRRTRSIQVVKAWLIASEWGLAGSILEVIYHGLDEFSGIDWFRN